ncbi:MAG TPA: hypothetical protein VK699_17990 [Terriglobales bacterium]|jgi:hypothetical protein|nr:hypothetical protein [Terriglobales bacterium]
MKKLQRIEEAGVIAEFLRNEFYHPDFHYDREKFERVVLKPDLTDELENALRRALLFRRRGHMWRELPADTEWWLVQVEAQDLEKIRVFPRAHWRKIADGSFYLHDIVGRIRSNHFGPSVKGFIAKIQSLSYRLRQEADTSSVLLIGVDEERAVTILEGNHRLTAAMLASPKLLQRQFRVLCGFSPHMEQCCWYQTNFKTLWGYFKNRISNLHSKDADVDRLLQLQSWRVASSVTEEKISNEQISPNAILDSK